MGLGKSKFNSNGNNGNFQPFLNHILTLNAIGLGICARNLGLCNNIFGLGHFGNHGPILNCNHKFIDFYLN